LQAGYTHFRLDQASSAQGTRLAGVMTNSNVSGTYGYGSFNAFGSGSATPIYAPTASAGATVIMLRAGDPGIENAFDAVEMLKRYPQ
jgi:hypothetical protein